MKTFRALLVVLSLASIVACGSDGDDGDEQTRSDHSIKVVIQGDGSGTVVHSLSPDLPCPASASPCIWNFYEDQILTTILTATPDASSTFAGWEGDCTGTAPCTITVDDKYDVTATFNLR